MKLIRIIFCLASSCLTVFFSLNASHAVETHGVLIITPATTNSPGALRKLVCFTSNGSKEITTLIGNVMYGMDETNIAILQTPRSDLKAGARLLIIDRRTFTVITDTNVDAISPAIMTIRT